MSTNVNVFPPFKYFDNDLTAFQIAEYHFPYGDHVANLRAHCKSPLTELYFMAEKERLKSLYPSYYEWKNHQQFGFVSKIIGHDWSLSSLRIDFTLWADKEDWSKNFELMRALNRSAQYGGHDDLDKFLETKFFEIFACGFNDALYLDELNNFNPNENANLQPAKPKTSALENISKRPTLKNVTLVLINSYKAHVEIEPLKLKDDWTKENKLKCYHIQRQITKGQRQIKPSEIEAAIDELEDFPEAKQFALKQLALINQK